MATLKKEPNRFRAVYGAARAASLTGDRAAARRYYNQLLKSCERGDKPGRAELAAVRQARWLAIRPRTGSVYGVG
jgi:hypothetical protein